MECSCNIIFYLNYIDLIYNRQISELLIINEIKMNYENLVVLDEVSTGFH